jgi:hypothetical protein
MSLATAALDPGLVQEYHERGYLILRGLFRAEEIAALELQSGHHQLWVPGGICG